jgi:phosphatidylglycerophosphatase A
VNRVGVALAGIISTWFGCGYFPWGPGTAGSLAAIVIAVLLHTYIETGRLALLVLTLVLLAPAIWAATKTARVLGKKDPSLVVVDEVLGQWVTLLGATALRWKSFCAAFLLFRLFDIWKPWPVRNFEKLPEGVGIVADDLAAGMYGALILYIGGKLRLY